MKKRHPFMHLFPFLLLLTALLAGSCKENGNALQVSRDTIYIETDGSAESFVVLTDASSWHLSNPAPDWISLSSTSGTGTNDTVSVIVSSAATANRSATLTLTAGNAQPLNILVFQSVFSLSSNIDSLSFKKAGGSASFAITTTASQWSLSTNVNWLTFNNTVGTKGTYIVSATATSNQTGADRTAIIRVKAQYGPVMQIAVTQSGFIYPSYNTNPAAPDLNGVESTAMQLASRMYAGWNLGNSLEVPNDETKWGNPKSTQRLIDSVYSAGFNAIRLPCAWSSHLSDASVCKINPLWLARVKEVIDYCYTHQLFIILNIHWDGGWLENNPTYAKQDEVNAMQKALWEQIATYFRNYDEHLMFAGTNEVHANYSTPSTENISVQQSYNQTFVNAVRSTGGKNAYRTLVIQGYNTDIDYTVNYLTVAADAVKNRLMVEVHYYSPWDFCGETGSSAKYLWGSPYQQYGSISSWGQESYAQSQFSKMNANFVSKGYPVILGEYSVVRRSSLTGDVLIHHLASRAYFLQFITEKAKNAGMVPYYWDNGGTDNNACGVFYRSTGAVFDRQALTALQNGAKNGHYSY